MHSPILRSTGPAHRLLPLVRPSYWHTKLARQALTAFPNCRIHGRTTRRHGPCRRSPLPASPVYHSTFRSPKVDFGCGGPRTLNAQKELACELEWKWCVRDNGRVDETLSCWRERRYFDEENSYGPENLPRVEKAKASLKLRLLKLSKVVCWRPPRARECHRERRRKWSPSTIYGMETAAFRREKCRPMR